MNTALKCWNRICNKKYQHLGFKKHKATFARIKNDILQSFTLKVSQHVPVCSVAFAIFPLCMPTPVFIDAGVYELDKFIVELYESNSGWQFNPHSEDSIANCIESISQAIDSFLLPFFDACKDCRSSLQELIKLEALFDCNRLKVLNMRGESDCAIPWKERSLFDSRKYYMALKAKDLFYAKQYLCHQIAFQKKTLTLFNSSTSPMQPEIVKERAVEKLIQYENELKQLEAGNWEYIDSLLCSNERNLQTYIAARYPSIWTH